MRLLVKKIFNKILIISMITVLMSFFCANSVSEAKLTLEEGQFYYTGTQEARYSPKAINGIWSTILNALAQVANFILGVITLAVRGVIIGWLEIGEIILTAILGVNPDFGKYFSEAVSGMDTYSQHIVNIEDIIFDRVPILAANFFKTQTLSTSPSTAEEIAQIIKNNVAKWYYVLRLIVIVFMLLLLIFIGIKIAISTLSDEKAVYKQMLIDWIVGMILVFSIHYIMIFILNTNDSLIEGLEGLTHETPEILQEYQFGEEENIKSSKDIEMSLYETARTRAYSLNMTDGFTGMIIYGALIYYAFRFTLMYYRRLLNIMLLTLIAPIVSVSYAFNKVLIGKAKVFSTWLSEFIMNVLIQIVHAIIYITFVSTALQLSLVSLSGTILAFVLLNFMLQADKILRRLFKLAGGKGSLAGDMADRTTFKAIRSELKVTRAAVMGGVSSRIARKAVYAPAKKVLGTVATYTAAGVVATKKNIFHDKEKEEEREKINDQQVVENAQEFLENNEKVNKYYKEIEELEAKNQELMEKLRNQERQVEAKRKNLKGKKGANRSKLTKMEEKLEISRERTEKEISANNKKILENEEKIKKAYLEYQIKSNGSITGTFAKNFRKAFSGLVEYRDGKYRIKKIKGYQKPTLYKRFNNAITEDEDAKKIRQHMTLTGQLRESLTRNKLFGLTASEGKIVDAIEKFHKKRIKSMAGLVLGVATFISQPLASVGLTLNSYNSHIATVERKMTFNRAKSNGTYHFKEAKGLNKMLEVANKYNFSEIQQLERIYNKAVDKKVKNQLQYAKYLENKENSIKNNVINLTNSYINLNKAYEEKIRSGISNESKESLYIEEMSNEKKIVSVGNDIYMQIENSIEMNKFINALKQINSNLNKTEEEKIELIQKEISENIHYLVRSTIVNYCVEEKIFDISKLELTDKDMYNINQKMLQVIENTGVVDRGKIDLEEAGIDEKAISNIYLNLMMEEDETNKTIEAEVVSNSVLQYMQKNGEKNVANLKTKEAKSEIYKIVKEQFMSEDSKKSAKVISKLKENSDFNEDFELGNEQKQSIEQSIEENIKKVKKITKDDILTESSKVRKATLEERKVKKKMNKLKEVIEKSLYKELIIEEEQNDNNSSNSNIHSENDEVESNLDEDQLQMLFLLSEIKKQNKAANAHGIELNENAENKKKNTLERLMFDEQIDGIKKFNSSKYGKIDIESVEDINEKDRKKVRSIEDKIYGPAADIIDLINNLESRREEDESENEDEN